MVSIQRKFTQKFPQTKPYVSFKCVSPINVEFMCFLKLKNKKLIELRQIVFDNVEGVFDYPKNIRIPNIGEYIWFGVSKQGKVISVFNKFDDSFFTITIRVGELR